MSFSYVWITLFFLDLWCVNGDITVAIRSVLWTHFELDIDTCTWFKIFRGRRYTSEFDALHMLLSLGKVFDDPDPGTIRYPNLTLVANDLGDEDWSWTCVMNLTGWSDSYCTNDEKRTCTVVPSYLSNSQSRVKNNFLSDRNLNFEFLLTCWKYSDWAEPLSWAAELSRWAMSMPATNQMTHLVTWRF